MMIVDNEDGGLNIKFSREDLVAMSPSDFQLLKLFVEALTEECEKEEVDTGRPAVSSTTRMEQNDREAD
jgi:hypothetical protein